MNKVEKQPRPLTDGYIRQILRQRGFEKEDITHELIELQRAKVEAMRTVRELNKKMTKG